MLQEGLEAPTVMRRRAQANAYAVAVLFETLRQRPPAFADTVVRGSTNHACTVLNYTIESCLVWPVVSISPSLSTLARAHLRPNAALFNVEDSELALAAEFVLLFHCGEERAVAATTCYRASIVAFPPMLIGLNPGTGYAPTDVLPSVLAFSLFAERLSALLGLNPNQPALLQNVPRTL